MTVCVFNPSKNELWADTTCMAGGYYTGHVNKISQRESSFYVHTLAVAGTSWLCTAVEKILMMELSRANAMNLDYITMQNRITKIMDTVPSIGGEQDAFDALLIEYSKKDGFTRVYKFNNTMFPFELKPFGDSLICIGQYELCTAVTLAYDVHMVNADLAEFKNVTIGEMINRLSKFSANVSPDTHAMCYNTKYTMGMDVYVP